MAILGGGPGGGGPVGFANSFTGASSALEYMGEHAYAQSGPFAKDTNEHTMIEYQQGSRYFVGTISFHGTTDMSNPSNGNISAFNVSFNDASIFLVKTDSSDENSPHSLTTPIIIPPYTEVKITGQDYSGGDAGDTSITMTGRIY
tara:strand:+ start:40 stop:474 length:435 start_codon:yes stop_codon:yes gene_type:complete